MAQINHVETGTQPNPQLSLIPSTWETDVRELDLRHRREAGLALAQSFAADPLSLYVMGIDDAACWPSEKIWRLHVLLMQYSYASYRFRGIATTIGGDYDAIALWMPPGTTNDDWLATLFSGMWRLWYQLPRESRKRLFGEMFPALHGTKAEVLGDRNGDSYYLGYLGTKVNSRGKGHATKLLRHMTGKADAENRAMYLESSNASNNRFYAKFGFEVKSEIVLTRGPVPVRLFCMLREPQIDKTSSLVDMGTEKD
ncbi:Acyl-CoA N-acyltransferase [Metarhizium album ARSEF 1941]|uniref:Acyl-CoA N-acyltransferase n=1 Tax=Metarhizium album (strain ARSEF 1941) TaxID=1081103 RepID=A0A0B2WPV3_METAS|nr:Acyl-CoA N-acyltransferase [Metarhizium album ARSEF 1941]KHN98076.1 Acyl-CoA N-acyltransferase [Metarhizium album ARSEF 1941]